MTKRPPKPEPLTCEEVEAVVAMVDLGVKAVGIQLYRKRLAGHLQTALQKLEGHNTWSASS